MEKILKTVREELEKKADEKTRAGSQRYFREHVSVYGVKASTVHQISKELFTLVASETKTRIFEICEGLWQSGYLEESFIACNWSWYVRKKYDPGDFEVFKKWILSYVNNWASCDTLCNHTVGEFIEMYPGSLSGLKELAKDSNRWARRASAVSLIIPARKGKFLGDILEISDILLLDEDDMVQKGYGWLLKAASEAHQNQVFEYIMKQKPVMPRTSLRYAIEKMPPELKQRAMAR